MAKVVDEEYWKRLWVEDNIGFHRSEVHPGLLKYVAEMTAGQEKCKVFVPLCGKSEDLKWLADRGHTVVGVELATLAIEAFFKENKLDFTTSHVEGLSDADLYKSQDDSIFIYKADIFDLNKDIMGEFDCIWDRASLVALPRQDIQRYADLMRSILKSKGRCLLETVEYDQSKMNGPPFSTAVQTVEQLYAPFEITSVYGKASYGHDDCPSMRFHWKSHLLLTLLPASDWDIKPLEVSDWTNDMWRRAGLDVISGRIALLTRKR